MMVTINLYWLIAGIYFGIGFIVAAIIFRDQRTKKSAGKALILSILAGLFWIVLALFIPFVNKEPTADEQLEMFVEEMAGKGNEISEQEIARMDAIKDLRAQDAESAPE